MIFVFGSNESGIHGAGAARVAMDQHGAVYGKGFGPQGNSFAIPTKDWRIGFLRGDVIKTYVDRFISYAYLKPDDVFQITAIGCGLAGKDCENMAKLFEHAPINCLFDEKWQPYLPKHFQYWGTF
jgi:hypothetical protein